LPDPDLAAHLETCAACRAELEAQRALFGAIDQGVADLVAGSPPEDFAAHVRQRIAQEAIKPRSWIAGWIPVTAAALALIFFVTLWVTRRGPAAPNEAKEKSSPSQIGRPPREPQMAGEVPAEPSPAGVSGARRIRPPQEGQMAARREPEVLVPPGQMAAVMQLYSSVWNGKADGASLMAQAAPIEESLKPLQTPELKIPPLEIERLSEEGKPTGSSGKR
jgi:hypothetical protein